MTTLRHLYPYFCSHCHAELEEGKQKIPTISFQKGTGKGLKLKNGIFCNDCLIKITGSEKTEFTIK